MDIRISRRAGNAVGATWQSPTDPRVTIPHDIRDAVELWARQNRGTHGKIAWNLALNCAVIDFELRANDPRMKAYQDGRLKHEPKESIPLHFQKEGGGRFFPINLMELGVSGIITLLDKGNTWSGTGEYPNMMKAIGAAERGNEQMKESIRAAARDNARDRYRDQRRQILGLPFVNVPDNIGAKADGTA